MYKASTPGINPKIIDGHFTDEEKKIIHRLSREWYITSGGGRIELGIASKYKYMLMKPTSVFQELFNFEREIIVVFSDYTAFEPRTLDAFDKAETLVQNLRIEKICSVLISGDNNIEGKLRNLLKSDSEYQVIIPFTYDELLKNHDSYLIRNRFKEHFYSRDLFAFQSPLKKDLYFFGRNDLVHSLVNRHRSNENSGLFGLRKTGKTSIIYGVQRKLKSLDYASVFIDCQNPSFHLKRWNKALKYVIDEIKIQNGISAIVKDEAEYNEDKAATNFEKDIIKIRKKLNKNILLIFDEIEHISPKISLSEHWKNNNDFIYFWQSLRSIFQKNNDIFTYLIVGTNPTSVETPFINGVDNPIYNQIPYEYINQFDVAQTKEMVTKLGGVMGLNFDELLFSKLAEDFGGHPFLIRNLCSVINRTAPKERPVRIDKATYEKNKEVFNSEYGNYIDMILSVLREYYSDEYEMLKFLALGDKDTFNSFAAISNEYTNHLRGYNILDYNNGDYFFKIEAVRQFLVEANKYKKINLTTKEKYQEISERRNSVEVKLRQIIRTTLSAAIGEINAKANVLDLFGEPRKNKYYAYSLKDVFNPNKSEIYFEDLKKIINKNWANFEHIFGRDKEGFSTYMAAINKYRVEAHAKEITDDEMSYFRVCATKIETYIDNYL
jgi:hypothetical protein